MAATLDIGSLSTLATGTGTSVAVNVPTGVDEGVLVLAFIVTEAGVALSAMPSGFSSFLDLDEAGGVNGHICGKVATSSEGSSYSFTLANGAASWAAWTVCVDSVDLSNFPTSALVGSNKGATETNGSSVIVSGVTAGAGDLLIGLMSSRGTGATLSSNGSVMTPMHSTQTHGSRTARAFYESLSGGATGNRQFDANQSTMHSAGIVALAAGPSAPSAPTITAVPTSWDAIRVQITADEDTDEVNIYRSTTSPVSDLDTLVATLDPTEETMAFDTELDPDTEYFYLAVASNEIGDTDSEEDSATTFEDDAISTFTTDDPIDFPLNVPDGQQMNSVQLRLGKIIRGMSGLDRAVSFDIVVTDENDYEIGIGTATNVPATENGSAYSVTLDPPAIGPQELTVTITPTIEAAE